MSKFVGGIEFITEICCNCGIPFAITRELYNRRKNDHKLFSCPMGHEQYYVGKSNEEKLKDQLTNKQRALDFERRQRIHAEEQEQFAKNQVRAHKGAKTKLMKRIHSGVCPCCTRHFSNLQRHMQNKHPDYVHDEHEAKVITFKGLREGLGLSQAEVASECNTKTPYVSMFERGKPLPVEAKGNIELWYSEKMEAHK